MIQKSGNSIKPKFPEESSWFHSEVRKKVPHPQQNFSETRARALDKTLIPKNLDINPAAPPPPDPWHESFPIAQLVSSAPLLKNEIVGFPPNRINHPWEESRAHRTHTHTHSCNSSYCCYKENHGGEEKRSYPIIFFIDLANRFKLDDITRKPRLEPDRNACFKKKVKEGVG